MGLLQRLEVPAVEGASRALDNDDLRPIPKERRTWGHAFYGMFWWTAVGNVTNMSGGSAWLTQGYSFWEGLGCSTAGYFLISLVMVINGRPGSKWHLSFPVAVRSSFGVFGSWWPTLNRAFMSCMWQGINAVSGGQCLYMVLYSMFPSIKNIPNTMSSSSGLDSAQMLCFFLFTGLVALLALLDMPKWNILVHIKVASFAISSAALLAWTITAGGGTGSVVLQQSTLTGSARAWGIVRMILTSAAGCSTFASNASDFQRMATTPNAPIFGQLVGFPLSNFLTQAIGMIAASTSTAVYGTVMWNPALYLLKLLEDNYDAKHRAAAFFIGIMFVYNLLFSCIFENVLPAGQDLSALCPRFISTKRGFMVCLLVSIVINPWYLLGTASIFITVVSSYQIFLFSIVGVMLVDYFLITKGFFDINALYSPRKGGKYYYTYGCNFRAFAAYLVGVAVNFAGFLTNFKIIVNVNLTRSYWFSILTTTFSAGFVYYVLNKLFPTPSYNAKWSEPQGVWEPSEDQLRVGEIDSGGSHSDEKEASFDGKDNEIATEVRGVPELRV